MFDSNLMIGIALVSLILLYSAFKLWEIQHQMLGIIFFFSALMLLLLIPNVLYDNQSNCYNTVANTTISADGSLINYAYIEQCFPQNSTVLDNFNGVYNNITTISYWYLLVAFLWMLFGDALKLTTLGRWGGKK